MGKSVELHIRYMTHITAIIYDTKHLQYGRQIELCGHMLVILDARL